MDNEDILQAIRDSLDAIVEPRFYETERGFQGQLLVELSKRIPEYFFPNPAIIEQEYQKTTGRHGIKLRPDIIIHRPFNPEIHTSCRDDNFAVIALKLRAGPKKAVKDFVDLQAIMTALHYPLGIFINISHLRTQASHIPANASGHIVAFATKLTANGVRTLEEHT